MENDASIFKVVESNFVWKIGENISFHFKVSRTLLNRLKWYVSTKLFLPGTYYWKEPLGKYWVNTKAKGSRNERRTQKKLTAMGYYTMLSKASLGIVDAIGVKMGNIEYTKDSPVDILYREPLVLMVQSKTNGHYNKSDIQQLALLASEFAGEPVVVQLWDWKHMQREPIITTIFADGTTLTN